MVASPTEPLGVGLSNDFRGLWKAKGLKSLDNFYPQGYQGVIEILNDFRVDDQLGLIYTVDFVEDFE